MELYGFLTLEEKQLFKLLLTVTGVGPKLALAVLSGLTPQKFRTAILGNDVTTLSSISGIGKKTAQRIILEVKAKLGEDVAIEGILGEGEAPLRDSDIVRALMSLGCTASQAKAAARKAQAEMPEGASVEEQIKVALKFV
jgi:Holliday junction DNA helicase RuvA